MNVCVCVSVCVCVLSDVPTFWCSSMALFSRPMDFSYTTTLPVITVSTIYAIVSARLMLSCLCMARFSSTRLASIDLFESRHDHVCVCVYIYMKAEAIDQGERVGVCGCLVVVLLPGQQSIQEE